jgi:hypothetical protein
MHALAAAAVVNSVRRRVSQEDCPTEPPFDIETLQDALLELDRLLSAEMVRSHEESAEVQRLQGFFLAYPRDKNGWICSVCNHWNKVDDKLCVHSHLGLYTL